MTREKPKNFHKINSYLFIGLDKIKKIVFQSISLKSNWLQTKITEIKENNSIIASQKSRIILLSSQIVNFHKDIENIIKIKAKNIIKYRNLFLIISLKVFIVMFNIKFYLIKIIKDIINVIIRNKINKNKFHFFVKYIKKSKIASIIISNIITKL